MEKLKLYIPGSDDMWFRQKMMSDPDTMSYNADLDVDFDGYHKDTGCIDFPEQNWSSWREYWIGNEPERFYAYIERTSDGTWIGEVNFHYTPEYDRWDIGIVIYAPYRGTGYSVTALRLLMAHAFLDCGVSRLHNDFEVTRHAALNAHLAAGFRKTYTRDGIVHMMLSKEEYLHECTILNDYKR